MTNNIPNHVAIIMDGNGRWAKKRLLPRTMGHKAGVDTIREIAIHASELGIKVLTLYAFSTENWGRPQEEVAYLMNLPKIFFKEFLPQLIEYNIKLETIGDIKKLPQQTLSVVEDTVAATKENTGMILNFAINYGSHEEMTCAMKEIAKMVESGVLKSDEITSELIESKLMTQKLKEFAQPDLMIRTSGELRLSNFLLWQLAYSEFYFTDILFPDFKPKHFDEALESFNQRQRRYGKVIE